MLRGTSARRLTSCPGGHLLARLRKRTEENEGGFTLIELLVVIIIIGILAAIAIPVFLNQRKKGFDASMKSDLRQVANEMESAYTDAQTYPTGTGGVKIKKSPGNVVEFAPATASTSGDDGFCARASNPKGSATGGTSTFYWYDSKLGGLQAAPATAATQTAAAGGACNGLTSFFAVG